MKTCSKFGLASTSASLFAWPQHKNIESVYSQPLNKFMDYQVGTKLFPTVCVLFPAHLVRVQTIYFFMFFTLVFPSIIPGKHNLHIKGYSKGDLRDAIKVSDEAGLVNIGLGTDINSKHHSNLFLSELIYEFRGSFTTRSNWTE